MLSMAQAREKTSRLDEICDHVTFTGDKQGRWLHVDKKLGVLWVPKTYRIKFRVSKKGIEDINA